MNIVTNAFHAMENAGGTLSIVLKEVELIGNEMEIRPNMPIIVSTGYSEKIDDEKCCAIGARALIMKCPSRTVHHEDLFVLTS